jgi:hypothetical protein
VLLLELLEMYQDVLASGHVQAQQYQLSVFELLKREMWELGLRPRDPRWM